MHGPDTPATPVEAPEPSPQAADDESRVPASAPEESKADDEHGQPWWHGAERVDHAVFFFFNRAIRNRVFDVVLGWGTYLGLGYVLYPLIAVALLIAGQPRAIETAIFLAVVSQVAGFPIVLAKRRIGRHRPLKRRERAIEAGESMPEVITHRERYYHSSFPSGHAANAMSAVVILAWLLGPAMWWLALLAVPVALSRVYNGIHWPADVAFGMAWGGGVAALLLLLYEHLLYPTMPVWAQFASAPTT